MEEWARSSPTSAPPSWNKFVDRFGTVEGLTGEIASMQDARGNTLVHSLVDEWKEELLVMALTFPDLNLEVKNRDGLTPLLMAAREGQWKSCFILMGAGANPRAKTMSGQGIMHEAVRNLAGLDTLNLLCALPGVEVDAPDRGGHTPLHLACLMHHTQTADFLIQRPNVNVGALTARGENMFHLLFKDSSLGLFFRTTLKRLIVDGRVDINGQNSSGDTPTHVLLDTAHSRPIAKEAQTILIDILSCPDIDLTLFNREGKNCYDYSHRVSRGWDLMCARALPSDDYLRHGGNRLPYRGRGPNAESMERDRAMISRRRAVMVNLKPVALALLAVDIPRVGCGSPLYPLHLSFLVRMIFSYQTPFPL
jgi:hypothetical protein